MPHHSRIYPQYLVKLTLRHSFYFLMDLLFGAPGNPQCKSDPTKHTQAHHAGMCSRMPWVWAEALIGKILFWNALIKIPTLLTPQRKNKQFKCSRCHPCCGMQAHCTRMDARGPWMVAEASGRCYMASCHLVVVVYCVWMWDFLYSYSS